MPTAPVAFGTSARSATRTDWPEGAFIGIRGTDWPDSSPAPCLPAAVACAIREAAASSRRKLRRVARALALLLMIFGALLLADAAITLLWQEPLTSLYAHVQQDRLERPLAKLADVPALSAERRAIARQRGPKRLALDARLLARHATPATTWLASGSRGSGFRPSSCKGRRAAT